MKQLLHDKPGPIGSRHGASQGARHPRRPASPPSSSPSCAAAAHHRAVQRTRPHGDRGRRDRRAHAVSGEPSPSRPGEVGAGPPGHRDRRWSRATLAGHGTPTQPAIAGRRSGQAAMQSVLAAIHEDFAKDVNAFMCERRRRAVEAAAIRACHAVSSGSPATRRATQQGRRGADCAPRPRPLCDASTRKAHDAPR